jgi:hypothetical protein
MFRIKDYVSSYERALDAMMARWRQGKPAVNLHVLADGTVCAD